jgi:hypothetical protein
MSHETRLAGQETDHCLRNAERWLRNAEDHAGKTGDKSLVKEVQKSHEVVTKVREDLAKKRERTP